MNTNDQAVILIVDDNKANLLTMESLLASNDRNIISAQTGKEALRSALHHAADLIILDVHMPDMDGFEVAQVLKSNKKTRDIPIIFASAEKKERKSMMQGFEEGAIDYLFKPLDPEILKAKVAVLLQVQLQKKELIVKNISLSRSALLINNSADIIGIIDAATFNIEEINHAFTAILGYTVAEAKGSAATRYLNKEDAELFARLAKKPKENFSFETRIYCKDRSIKWLQWRVVAKEGKWFINGRDITQQKTADEHIQQLNKDLQANVEQLEAANKELEAFSYSVSHDLRAPLRALNGYSQIFAEEHGQTLDDDAKRLLANIQNNAKRMGMLIDDLLAFSKLGRKSVQMTTVNMADMVSRVISEIDHITPHNAQVNTGELHPAQADAALLYQVWMNLISNAIKYSAKKEHPVVEIGSALKDNEVTYYVKDNGAGFDMRYAQKLFGVFQRLHSNEEFEGTGIGLATVYRIITKHGGRVWAEAKENEGAAFYFTLPSQA